MKTFGSLNKPQPRYKNPMAIRAYRERHECCELCGSTNMFGCPAGGVHHIVFKSQQGGDSPENIIFLCADCHGKAHSGIITKKDLQKFKEGLKWNS